MIDPTSYNEELKDLESRGLRRTLRPRGAAATNLSSNDYLGLAEDDRVRSAARRALDEEGLGGASSRLLAGTAPSHGDLERDLAAFFEKEAALVFSSGYHANLGTFSALAAVGDVIFVDRLCHASIIDGIRLSRIRFHTYDHNNADHLESLVRKHRASHRRAFIVTEGAFSMDGDLGILPEIIYVARRFDVTTYLDEAHTIGVFGPEGRGFAAQLGLLKDVDIFVGTLSKSLGSQGGFVAAPRAVIDTLVSRARSFIYTTSLAPPCAAGAREALRLLPSLNDRRDAVRSASERLRRGLGETGFDTLESRSPIVPVWTGSNASAAALSDYLFESGYFVPSIRPPTVPPGESRVRLSVTYGVANGDLEALISLFRAYPQRPKRLGKRIG